MATQAATTRNISGLARAMAQHGLMTEYEAETLQAQAQQAGATFVDHVLAGKRISSSQLAIFASRAFGVPLLDLSACRCIGAATVSSSRRPTPPICRGWKKSGSRPIS
jgi:hypothetical protein